MASTEQKLRREIEQERERLTDAVGEFREELGEATNVRARLRSKLPMLAAGAVGFGFLKAGGVGKTARLLFRRGRKG